MNDADLTEANLSRANLSGADLRKSNLTECNLHMARLEGADLSGVDLNKATVTNEQLRQVSNLVDATMPDGTKMTQERWDEFRDLSRSSQSFWKRF